MRCPICRHGLIVVPALVHRTEDHVVTREDVVVCVMCPFVTFEHKSVSESMPDLRPPSHWSFGGPSQRRDS